MGNSDFKHGQGYGERVPGKIMVGRCRGGGEWGVGGGGCRGGGGGGGGGGVVGGGGGVVGFLGKQTPKKGGVECAKHKTLMIVCLAGSAPARHPPPSDGHALRRPICGGGGVVGPAPCP